MSWAEEDWTVGLSGRVLQKVKELQVQQERLSRENKQKQLQLDNIHTSLEKQTVKYDEVRVELHSVQRELQSVSEEAKAALINRERLAQELQTKQAQACSFEGQLDAARTLNNKLTQEVKRLEAELEKLQNSGRPADTTLYSTPCWSASSPWEHNGSRKEEERLGRQDETQNQAQHIRQRLHFSDTTSNSVPRQQHRGTPHRHPSDQSECFSTPLAAFPWERDDTRPTTRRQSPTSPPTPCADVITQAQASVGLRGKEQDSRTETDMSQMQKRVSCLEEELSEKTRMLKSTQSDLVQSKKDVGARDISLQKARDELSLANTCITRESERASGAEQRLKQLQEELRCQRQNTESSRLQHQQRTKDMEKQHQRDLSELQKERQWMEKQHQQEANKLNQELQQARTLHNALQAQADKLSLQKQALDKELETMKEKLKWTEAQLQESQKKEAQTQAKLMEALREAEGVAVSLEQSRKRERGLEEEGRRLAEERADALRLLKDLQEQKTAPAPQIVQFCPGGQSFSPQPSPAPHSRLSAHTKRTTAPIRAEHRKEDMTEERAEITASYPSDREPGEGIDSEHISKLLSTETLQREGVRRKSNERENLRRNEEMESDGSFDSELFRSSRSDVSTNTSEDSSEKPERSKTSENLQRENDMLRSEINDVREELNRRLEDLESQRRAEAEARTRLKQFSRRFSSQALEKEEQDKEWKTQLESERAETERLKQAMAALETEMKTRNQEGEKPEEEEKNKALEDRENEMIELNIQLKKQLSQVKAQLALEQEERTREEEVRNQITVSDTDEKKELRIKVEELEAEVEELKRSREAEDKGGEGLPPASSPLVYLTLHDDEPNSVNKDNRLLPSPEQHLLFCRSTNQINMLVSQATTDLIQQEQTLIDPKQSPQSDDGQPGQLAPDPEDYLGGSLPSKHGEEISPLQKSPFASSDLEREVKQLRKEKKGEIERGKQSQVKLEALQSQVTRQTQQLTMAFEKQSQHITGLLAELQEKESALLSQGEELQRCKQELKASRAEKVDMENQRQSIAEKPKSIELQPNKEKDHAIISNSTTSLADEDSAVQTDEDQSRTDAETLTPLSEDDSEALLLGGRRPGSVDSDKTESNLDSACVMEEFSPDAVAADMMSELLSLRQENQLLRQRTEGFALSEKVQPDSPIEGIDVTSQCHTAVTSKSLQRESRGGNGGDANVEQITETQVEDEESQYHIQVLEQQVVALQMKIQALSQETQQQTEELALWRLASQSAPSYDQNTPSKDNQDHNWAVKQLPVSAQVPQETEGHVTVIREDELLLSDSSHKLQGRMLFSSLQHKNLPEPKHVHLSKKTAALQEHNQDSAQIDEESEKENVLQWSDICPSQHKEEREADVIRRSSEMTSPHFPKGPSKTKATENPAAKPNVSKMTSATNPASDSTNVKSVGSQTEERLYLTSPELKAASTQTEEEEEEEEEEEDEVESPPVSPLPSSAGAGSGDKMLFAGSFPIPADPARLAERIRRNRTQLSAAFDDTEYEPYGLPEVVMKGFADIPTGPSCPYIVRRGLLGTVVPVTQKDQGPEDETD